MQSPETGPLFPLHNPEDKYRRLFESMDQGFCIVEMIFDGQGRPVDYRFVEINPVFSQQTGLRDVPGKTARQLLPDLEERWFEVYGKVALTGQAVRFVEGAEAMSRWFEVYAFRLGGTESREVAILFTDITKRRLTELALLEKDANLRNIVHHAPVAMFIFKGEEMVIDTANEKALALIRRTEAVVGKPLLEAVPELKGTPAFAVLTEVYQTGITQYGQEVLVPLERAGVLEDRWFNFTYTPLVENGRITGVMDVATEVTEQVTTRKKIEEVVAHRTGQLAEANRLLEASNQELLRSNQNLEEFAHAASHDLKEPVRKIHFFTNQLKAQLDRQLTEAQRHSFERIENASQRMINLIDDLLTYSHITQRPHEMEDVDIAETIGRVLEDLELTVREKKAAVTAKSLPVVRGHRRQLQQLFQNLIGNAVKYGKADVAPVIDVSATVTKENEQPYHVISVKDNGIGFDQQYAEKIFQMFTRLHGKNEYSGTGVGLSIVKRVVENHNGFVRVQSEPGEGSVFQVYLPA